MKGKIIKTTFVILITSLIAVLIFAEETDETAKKFFEYGKYLCQHKKFKEGIPELRKFLEKFPNSEYADDAQMIIARAYDSYGRYFYDFVEYKPEQAINEYQKLIDDYPQSEHVFQARKAIARIYEIQLQDYSKAIELYEKIGRHYEAGNIYFYKLRNYEKALFEYKKIDLGDRYIRFKVAECHRLLGNYKEAIQIYETLAKSWKKARKELKFITENSDYNWEPLKLYDIANSYLEDSNQERRTQGLKFLYKILNEYPNAKIADDTQFRIAEYYSHYPSWSQAVVEYQKVVTRYPKSELADQALLNIGEIYRYRLEDYNKAVESFNRLLKFYPTSNLINKAQYQLGACYFLLKDYENAFKELQKVRVDPTNYEVQEMLGEIYILQGNIEKALEVFTRGETAKSSLTSLQRLASAAKVVKKYDIAIKTYQRIIKEFPETREALHAQLDIAYIYDIQLKNPAKAIEAYQKIINNYPRDSFIIPGEGSFQPYNLWKIAEERIERLGGKAIKPPLPAVLVITVTEISKDRSGDWALIEIKKPVSVGIHQVEIRRIREGEILEPYGVKVKDISYYSIQLEKIKDLPCNKHWNKTFELPWFADKKKF